MSGVRQVRIGPEDAGQRVDNFLMRQLKGVPRSLIYRLLRSGQVRVDGKRTKPPRRLATGETVRIPPVQTRAPQEATPPARLQGELAQRILYEDDRLLVIDKPSGLAVHGGSGLAWGLIEVLRQARPSAPFLELVHRLDRATSGCLMVAKRRSALRELHEQLRTGAVHKRYLALLTGALGRGPIPVEAPLERRSGPAGGVRVASHGKLARTVFRAVARPGGMTLAEADIATGRTHQIRVHAAHLGMPIAGDDRYGERAVNRRLRGLGLKRLFLHAHRLELSAPGTGQPLSIEAPLPDELAAVVAQLQAPQQSNDSTG
ncbi:RluA family pseudouridine synthase [Alkalilimnicola ehrlichii MLHE-1]|nr:RluA family pseudouridine synthase [Alkalilimnicola ehrlichii]